MKKLATLLALYFAQGLPFGFQATALPLMLRERGVSLQAIGFAGLLSAPWMAKALWAPWVDRFGSARFGRRKSWIVPMQGGLVVAALIAAQTPSQAVLLALIFIMNLLAATQDIATDGLAVGWLQDDELGPGNAIQVVGYKLGMLTGGGLLVWASPHLGWSGLFHVMAAMLLLVLLIALTLREPVTVQPQAEHIDFGRLLTLLRRVLFDRTNLALIAVVLTYKMGESLATAMWKPMLFDRGFGASNIGLWDGTYGMICSLLGSLASGWLVRRHGARNTLPWVACLRALGVGAQLWLSLRPQPGAEAVIAVTCIEHLFGGAITTVLFTLMMRHSEREIGATHYTLLASLEVWGKVPLSTLSGVIADALGYPALYAIATALCVGFIALAAAARPRLEARSRGSSTAAV